MDIQLCGNIIKEIRISLLIPYTTKIKLIIVSIAGEDIEKWVYLLGGSMIAIILLRVMWQYY